MGSRRNDGRRAGAGVREKIGKVMDRRGEDGGGGVKER